MTDDDPSDEAPLSLPFEMLRELKVVGAEANKPPTLEQWQTLLLRIAHRFRDDPNPLLRISSALSHELRTPMTVVIGGSELLLETNLDPLQRQAAQNVHSSGQELRSVIDQILSAVTEDTQYSPPRSNGAAGPDLGVEACPGRVLLAEDNEFNRVLIERALLTLHCQVEVAESGREAVRKFRSSHFDLVIMDCHMPDMDGLEATRQIRSHEAPGRRVPIVAVTAGTVPGARKACLAAGMDEFIAKPFSLSSLRRTVMHFLTRRARPADPQRLVSSAASRLLPASGTHARSLPVSPVSVDLSRLNELAEESGSPTIVAELALIFVDDMGRRIETLRQALNDEDKLQFLSILHCVKGASSNFGAPRMASLAETAERRAKRGEFLTLDSEVTELSTEFELVRSTLETQLLGKPSANGPESARSRAGTG